jgi:hypothetical protein
VTSKYWPCPIDELPNRRSLISEPLPPANVVSLPRSRSLHAVLVESLNATKALQRRLEDGVSVSKNQDREIIRLLFVATRHQVKALIATLECEGLE